MPVLWKYQFYVIFLFLFIMVYYNIDALSHVSLQPTISSFKKAYVTRLTEG